MTKYNKQYIVVKLQYVLNILQYIAIRFWHIVTALLNTRFASFDTMYQVYMYFARLRERMSNRSLCLAIQ